MAETVFRGPTISLGATMDPSTSPTDGPSMDYQGVGFLDPRANGSTANKDSVLPGVFPGFLQCLEVQVIDNIPSTLSSTTIAAAQVATSGTAFALATAALGGSAAGVPSYAPGIPIVPLGTTVVATVAAIDFGFTTGTTVANSSTVAVVDSTMFQLGQWICIGGAGAASNASGLLTQVVSIANLTTLNIFPVAVAALSHAPIGQANLFNSLSPPSTQFGPQAATPNGVSPYRVAGEALLFDPVQAISRTLQVAASTVGGGTATILVSGYDIYGVPMTELFTASGTTAQIGKKAFKYITSVVPTASGSATYTVGVSDTFGLPLRSDRFDALAQVVFGNNIMATAAGWTSAITTSPATNTTGDVRGTINVQSLGGAVGTSNGTSRLGVVQMIPLLSTLNANPASYTSLFGVTQA